MADRIAGPSPKIPRLAPATENEDWMTGKLQFVFIRCLTSWSRFSLLWLLAISISLTHPEIHVWNSYFRLSSAFLEDLPDDLLPGNRTHSHFETEELATSSASVAFTSSDPLLPLHSTTVSATPYPALCTPGPGEATYASPAPAINTMIPRPVLHPVQIGPSLMSGYPQQSMGLHQSQVATNHGTSSHQVGPVGMNIRGEGIMGQLPRNILGNPNQHMASYYPQTRSPMMIRPRMPVNLRPLNAQQHPGMRPTLPPRPLMRSHTHPSIEPLGYQGQAQEGCSTLPQHQSSFQFSAPPVHAGLGHMGSPVTSRAPQFVGGATRPLSPPSWTTYQAPPPAQQLTPPAHCLTPNTLSQTNPPQSQPPSLSSWPSTSHNPTHQPSIPFPISIPSIPLIQTQPWHKSVPTKLRQHLVKKL